MQTILETASKRFPQFEEHARFLSVKQGGVSRWGGLVKNTIAKGNDKAVGSITEDSKVTREQFKDMLTTIDLGLRGLPATAQVR